MEKSCLSRGTQGKIQLGVRGSGQEKISLHPARNAERPRLGAIDHMSTPQCKCLHVQGSCLLMLPGVTAAQMVGDEFPIIWTVKKVLVVESYEGVYL